MITRRYQHIDRRPLIDLLAVDNLIFLALLSSVDAWQATMDTGAGFMLSPYYQNTGAMAPGPRW